MTGDRDARLRRLRMRAWRRGTREMDLILGPFADAMLDALAAPELDALDALLEENDQDLLAWILGQRPAPPGHAALVSRIGAHARERFTRPG